MGFDEDNSADAAIISFTELSDNGFFEYISRDGRILIGCCFVYVSIEAIRKAKEDAIKKLVTVPINENGSIPYGYTGEFGSAKVLLKSAPEGTGIIAGGPARSVCELAGIQNIRTKSLGSSNKQNVVLATIDALSQLKSPEEVAKLRGKTVEEILG